MSLGTLEKKVMEYIWQEAPDVFSVRDVTDALNAQPGSSYAYNTILTVMTHLYTKKLLSRKKVGKQCIYAVRLDKSAYVARSSRALFEKMQKEYGSLAIAHFADLVEEIDPAVLAQAKKVIEKS